MKTLALSKYFEVIHPSYIYLKIIPHKSIRNCNSSNIAKSMSDTYKNIIRRVHMEQKKVFIETEYKISYITDITKNNSSFYFLIPTLYKDIILEKINEIWSKAAIEELEGIPKFTENKITYQLGYKKDDALSLKVDKRTNEPLNHILNVIDIMKYDDRVTIAYNFMPCSQFGWKEKYDAMVKKFEEKKPLEKKITFEYVLKIFLGVVAGSLDCILSVVSDFLGNSDSDNENLYKKIMIAFEEKTVLSSSTTSKKNTNVIATQIAVISDSQDRIRKQNNALAVCQSYNILKEDNELMYKKIKKNFNLKDYDYKIDTSLCSVDECKNFLQVPGYDLINQFKMKCINVEETKIPEELREGKKRLGEVTYKGSKIKSYLEDEYNIGNLPLCLIGTQGGGKTTYIGNYAYDCSNADEGIVLIDFIKNCELSETIKKVIPKEKIVEIDLSKEEEIQGLGYNEIIIDDNMSDFDKLKLSNMQSQQIMSFVDAISVGDPLSSRMRRFLNAAASIVLVQKHNSIKNVVECLEDYQKREQYIKGLNSNLAVLLEDEIKTIEELDEYTKATKDKESEKCGTKDSKIEHILDRISMLREDFKLKYMYNKNLKDNINLVKCMEEGKVVIIKMKEDDFPSKMVKNLLVTYWISKVWLASQIRGSLNDKPLRCNIIIDEVFQAPTCMKTLEYILPQARKFGCKFVFSTQYIRKLDSIFESLEASGSSFMLLKGILEDDFNHFKDKLSEFEFEDLKNMKQWSSLNLIYYSGGYVGFISKLPLPLN